MTEAATAAVWMDRLCDRLGAFVPGGYRLPPRHPIKVSLVMGLLGMTSGWTTMVISFAIHYVLFSFFPFQAVEILDLVPFSFNFDPQFVSAQLLSGLMVGLFVLAPLATWAGRRVPFLLLLIGISWLANNCAWWVFRQFEGESDHQTEFFIVGFVIGVSLVIQGLFIDHNGSLPWAVFTVLISAFSNWLIFSGVYYLDQYVADDVLEGWRVTLEFGWYFSLCDACNAICLGMLRWDVQPQPTFKPHHSAPPQEPVS